MKILIVHNHYLQPGGEDVAVAAEAALLRNRGHTVELLETSNEDMETTSAVRAAAGAVWSYDGKSRVSKVRAQFAPDVVHFHNTFPRLSPSVYYAADRAAVVQTLHNFRLVCPAATLLRDGKPCEECVGRFAWPGVMHACYRGSRAATFASAAMVQTHRAVGTWRDRVDAYIALTPFTRDVFLRGGLPADKLYVKPNFVDPDPSIGSQRGSHFLFVGRFEEGKGIRVLMEAWRSMDRPPPLRLIGSGPFESEVREFADGIEGVTVFGRVARDRVIEELKQARAYIAPLLWYENFPLAICEAMATGTPVIAADVANVRDILQHGNAGLLFERANAQALVQAVRKAVDEPEAMSMIARAAREQYERCYTADANYQTLMHIYGTARARKVEAVR